MPSIFALSELESESSVEDDVQNRFPLLLPVLIKGLNVDLSEGNEFKSGGKLTPDIMLFQKGAQSDTSQASTLIELKGLKRKNQDLWC